MRSEKIGCLFRRISKRGGDCVIPAGANLEIFGFRAGKIRHFIAVVYLRCRAVSRDERPKYAPCDDALKWMICLERMK